MEKNLASLVEEFKRIKKMGYVESISAYRSKAGDTFEKLLGKESDELAIPDYGDIEIKTKKGYSKTPITLFSANPDNQYYYAFKGLVEKYGKIKDGNPSIILMVNGISKSYLNNNGFKLEVDYEKKIVKLNVYNRFGKLVDDEVSWSFELIEERVMMKLQNLALVKCCTKVINNKEYYWYYKMFFYKGLTLNNFLKGISEGKISILFSVGTYKSGPKIGKMHSHGTAFRVMEDDLLSLYNRFFSC